MSKIRNTKKNKYLKIIPTKYDLFIFILLLNKRIDEFLNIVNSSSHSDKFKDS